MSPSVHAILHQYNGNLVKQLVHHIFYDLTALEESQQPLQVLLSLQKGHILHWQIVSSS